MDPFVICFFIFVLLSCLFLAALRSPAGKEMTYWFSCVCDVLSLSHMVSWVRYGA